MKGRRWRDERGMVAATLLLFPLFAVVAFMFVQTILWQHQRQLASAQADKVSAAVAMYGSDPGTAQAEAISRLQSAGMEDVNVSVTRGATETVVVVSGQAPGIIVGTSSTITARSVTPSEGWRDP